MGNIATPNTPYCLGFQQASLSVGNKTFSTQHSPISYAIDGSTVTIFDALGVIGITPYSSDDFVEISSSPASPNTNYCSSAKAVLSWSSGTVETLNTPINYQLRSNIVEWGNSGVVQGIYNAPTAISSASIQSNANKLLINGQIETFNKPVASWQFIPQNQIKIDWDNEDVVFLNGSSWVIRQGVRAESRFATTPFDCGNSAVRFMLTFPTVWQPPYTPIWIPTIYNANCGVSQFLARVQDGNANIVPPQISNDFNCWQGNQAQQIGQPPIVITINNFQVVANSGESSYRENKSSPTVTLIQCILRITFTDNTTQDLSYSTCPTVQSIPGCTVAIVLANSTTENILVDPCPDFVNVINNEVTVFDDTGQIFKADYLTPPLNFQVTCYDFNVTEVSYVCQGDCPSGTEFRCVCPTTNTIMCYGFDPENPNVFKPLFTTQITS